MALPSIQCGSVVWCERVAWLDGQRAVFSRPAPTPSKCAFRLRVEVASCHAVFIELTVGSCSPFQSDVFTSMQWRSESLK